MIDELDENSADDFFLEDVDPYTKVVLFGLIMIATTYGYYMLNLRKAVELKYSNGSRYWQTDDIETIPKEIADLV